LSKYEWEKYENIYPYIHPFITFRRERFGGYLFNPHMYVEKPVDEIGMYLLELIDGRNSVSDLAGAVVTGFNMPHDNSFYLTSRYLNEFFGYHAIKWLTEPIDCGIPNNASHALKQDLAGTQYYSAPLSVLWDITYRCNLSCPHCLIDRTETIREMTLDEIDSVFTQLSDMRVFTINFSGGEPLLRSDFLQIAKKASDYNFGIRLSTNGILLSDSMLQRLGDCDVFCFQISVDGIGDRHDNFRGMNGAYEKAIDALERAIEQGFRTSMSTMITSYNLDQLPELVDIAASLGVSSFKLNSFMPVGTGACMKMRYSVPKENIAIMAERLVDKKNQYDGSMDVQISAMFPWLVGSSNRNLQSLNDNNQDCAIKCSAGHSNMVLSPDGTVYACPYLTDFPLGNILENTFHKIWHDNDGILGKLRNMTQSDVKGKCSHCEHVPEHCIGGCRASAYIESGDLYDEDPFCWKEL
jgi:radical SAM protein with 4Fe4S-binding SPASM domain